jgi:hypothetical protein
MKHSEKKLNELASSASAFFCSLDSGNVLVSFHANKKGRADFDKDQIIDLLQDLAKKIRSQGVPTGLHSVRQLTRKKI